MEKTNIAILGAGSHIARGIIDNSRRRRDFSLTLFTRDAAACRAFLDSLPSPEAADWAIRDDYEHFGSARYDLIVNCVGAGTPSRLGGRFSDWFTLTEKFDNLCLDYLREVNPEALYVNFSSGAVYGGGGDAPAEAGTINPIRVNQLPISSYYSIARLNSEAKHRSFEDLRIADLRIFSYFSRFAPLNSGYFMTDLASALLEKRPLATGAAELVRDYIAPEDLWELILKCLAAGQINAAFDAFSAAPVTKTQILARFRQRFGLEYRVEEGEFAGPNGSRNIYCSNYRAAAAIGYAPVYASLATLEKEMEIILNRSC